jgi:hypothetical protein
MQIPLQQPTPPEFSLELTNKAAKKNYLILMHKYRGNITALLESQRDLTAGYGLEFFDENTLSHLFARHPNWNRMAQILQNGSKWPLGPLNKDSRRANVDEALTFGNHKGALMQPELF